MIVELVLRPGFEPGSRDRESLMLGRTTYGCIMDFMKHLPELRRTSPERGVLALDYK
jgi:hypothetical protein